jgi:hypothetical protein
MQHMVIYRASDGRPLNHQTDDIEGAVKFVEHLRNEEQVAESAIYQMVPVPIAFKTYYRVEVAGTETAPPAIQVAAGQAAVAAATAPAAVAPTAAVAPPAEQPVPVSVGAAVASGAPESTSVAADAGAKAQIVAPTPVGNGRFGLFSRG